MLAYQNAYGINLASLATDVWLGRRVRLRPGLQRYVLQKAVYAQQRGTVARVSGLSEVRKMKEVWKLAQWTRAGEEIRTFPRKPKPIYSYYLAARSRRDLERLSQVVESTIQVVVK